MVASSKRKLLTADRAEKNRMKAQAWRAKMRAKGLRPVQLWVYDSRDPAFLAECRRQAQLAAASEHEAATQAWIDDVSADIWKE